jgi:CubicO group peptidase (beta-lactamase class C family)
MGASPAPHASRRASSAPASPGRSCFLLAVCLAIALAGCSSRAGNPARIASGYVSHVVCSYVFVSGLDPARVAQEEIAANPAFQGFHWAYSTAATPGAAVGYGAGWWINAGDSPGARFRREHGMPADAFMALGAQGQTVVVVPSARLVVARFGTTYDARLAMRDIYRLTADSVAALRDAGVPPRAETMR